MDLDLQATPAERRLGEELDELRPTVCRFLAHMVGPGNGDLDDLVQTVLVEMLGDRRLDARRADLRAPLLVASLGLLRVALRRPACTPRAGRGGREPHSQPGFRSGHHRR